jgi:hypothetical protein
MYEGVSPFIHVVTKIGLDDFLTKCSQLHASLQQLLEQHSSTLDQVRSDYEKEVKQRIII